MKGGRKLGEYLGIIIEKSLKETDVIKEFQIVGTRRKGSWNFLLVSVSEEKLEQQIRLLQQHMIDIEEDCWYAHYFRKNELVVVYQDKVFRTSTSPETWQEVIQYGLDHGIPLEQLDFNPRTMEGAYGFFDIG